MDAQAEAAAAIPIPSYEDLEHFELPDRVLADTTVTGERSIPLSLLCPQFACSEGAWRRVARARAQVPRRSLKKLAKYERLREGGSHEGQRSYADAQSRVRGNANRDGSGGV